MSTRSSKGARYPWPVGEGDERMDGRRTRHAHRRPELLAQATDYVFEHGLSELRIRPLAEELGLTHRGLLHHFGSMEQLVSEILTELRTRDRRSIADLGGHLTASGDDPILIAWHRMSGEPYLKYWGVYFEVFSLALRHPERYGRFLEGIVDDWLELLEPLLIEAGCSPSKTDSLASLLLATFRGLFMDLLATGDRLRVDRAAADLAAATRLMIQKDA